MISSHGQFYDRVSRLYTCNNLLNFDRGNECRRLWCKFGGKWYIGCWTRVCGLCGQTGSTFLICIMLTFTLGLVTLFLCLLACFGQFSGQLHHGSMEKSQSCQKHPQEDLAGWWPDLSDLEMFFTRVMLRVMNCAGSWSKKKDQSTGSFNSTHSPVIVDF